MYVLINPKAFIPNIVYIEKCANFLTTNWQFSINSSFSVSFKLFVIPVISTIFLTNPLLVSPDFSPF